MDDDPTCDCLTPQYKNQGWPALYLRDELRHKQYDVWHRLLELIDLAARDGRKVFDPAKELG